MKKLCLALIPALLLGTAANAAEAQDVAQNLAAAAVVEQRQALSPKSFSLMEHLKAGAGFVVNTDAEPDDALAIGTLLPELSRLAQMYIQPVNVAIIAGGANAHIAKLKIEELVEAMRADGFIGNTNIEIIRGASESEKVYSEQGDFLRNPERLAKIEGHKDKMAKLAAEPGDHAYQEYIAPETQEINDFFAANPRSLVWNLKRPEEFICYTGLDILKDSTIITYLGIFNTSEPHRIKKIGQEAVAKYKKEFLEFLQAGQANACVSNVPVIQQGNLRANRSVTTMATPELIKGLEHLTMISETGKYLADLISNWNGKIAWDALNKMGKAKGEILDQRTWQKIGDISAETHANYQQHFEAIDTIKNIITEMSDNARMIGDSLYKQRLRMFNPEDPIYKNLRKAIGSLEREDGEVLARQSTFLSIQEDPKWQMVMADFITSALTIDPDFASEYTVGTAVIASEGPSRGFVQVEPNPDGNVLYYNNPNLRVDPRTGEQETGSAALERTMLENSINPMIEFLEARKAAASAAE
ncbi:MAG: hypothetical protein WCG04_02740 [Alphaproteobacteria bacterium]